MTHGKLSALATAAKMASIDTSSGAVTELRALRALRDAVLSEPAAEADESYQHVPGKVVARGKVRWEPAAEAAAIGSGGGDDVGHVDADCLDMVAEGCERCLGTGYSQDVEGFTVKCCEPAAEAEATVKKPDDPYALARECRYLYQHDIELEQYRERAAAEDFRINLTSALDDLQLGHVGRDATRRIIEALIEPLRAQLAAANREPAAEAAYDALPDYDITHPGDAAMLGKQPPAEADEPLQARQWREAFERAQDDVHALRAQLAAAKRDYFETTEGMRREQAELCSQLASAAPLFEAAIRYNKFSALNDLAVTADEWARSEAGQRWKREQGK